MFALRPQFASFETSGFTDALGETVQVGLNNRAMELTFKHCGVWNEIFKVQPKIFDCSIMAQFVPQTAANSNPRPFSIPLTELRPLVICKSNATSVAQQLVGDGDY